MFHYSIRKKNSSFFIIFIIIINLITHSLHYLGQKN